jgi:hypothetical protein
VLSWYTYPHAQLLAYVMFLLLFVQERLSLFTVGLTSTHRMKAVYLRDTARYVSVPNFDSPGMVVLLRQASGLYLDAAGR